MNPSAATQRSNVFSWLVRVLAGVALLSTVSGCHIPGLRGAQPTHQLPDTFVGVATEDNSIHNGLNEFFNDPLLTNLICEGLVGNQELKILAEDIQIANNEVLRRRGLYLPFLGLGGRAGLEKPSLYTPLGAVEENLDFEPGRGFPTPLPNFLVAANMTWQIDIWRQLRNARDAATLRYLGTTDGRNYVVTRLVAEIATNYYTLVALDKQLETLDLTIGLQESSLKIAQASKEGARGTELPVQRFQAEVRKNQSEKLILRQEIIETENRINFLLGRYPQPVERANINFIDMSLPALRVGVPSQLLMNRPDIRQAERELAASGLDIKVARANFYPKLTLTAGVGFEGFNPRYLVMTPESLVYNAVGELTAPLVNRTGIKADYFDANARQLQACYKYQQVILQAFAEVANGLAGIENYGSSLKVKQEQLTALEKSVDVATKLFYAARIEYFDVLFAQRDMMDARMGLIDTKREQLAAIVDTYQALGGGLGPLNYTEVAYVEQEEALPPSAGPSMDDPAQIPPAPAADDGLGIDGAPLNDGVPPSATDLPTNTDVPVNDGAAPADGVDPAGPAVPPDATDAEAPVEPDATRTDVEVPSVD